MDVKNTFLIGNLSEKVYTQPPPSLFIELNKACHIQRALYGLKQALPSLAWLHCKSL